MDWEELLCVAGDKWKLSVVFSFPFAQKSAQTHARKGSARLLKTQGIYRKAQTLVSIQRINQLFGLLTK